ncbi:PAS domain S-box protein [Hymenobacter gummosus]|uniref:histidine kinase n=1 Tax=Hymenobacter gummosus TaxID=1776032 RepID=A0A3S0JG98_9BACT|nr:PAS domain-containing protein [Hymenobacter gummosus]RTQ52254.1 PAS domain S-box protein [Hymenobacter gummosus]
MPVAASAATSPFEAFFELSPTPAVLYEPVYDPAGKLVDFAFFRLNAAAQQVLGLPAQPTSTYRTQFPGAASAGFGAQQEQAFVRRTPVEASHDQHPYGLDGAYRVRAERVAEQLLVSFIPLAPEAAPAAADAPAGNEELRAANRQLAAAAAAVELARAEAELQRRQLHHVLEQAPAMICIFDGPAHVFQFVNPPYQALVGERRLLGKPIAEAMPELTGQPIFGLLDQVYQTGETYYAHEMLVQLDHLNEGRPELEQRYYNFIYQARRDVAGAIDGILVFAYDVTGQVRARQQAERARQEVDHLNEELAATNEELQASNEEYLTANTALSRAQQDLQQLNQVLEVLIAERTRQIQEQSNRLERLIREAPAAICMLDGPDLVVELLNAEYQALFPDRQLLGKPILEALPELIDGPGAALLRRVQQTGVTFKGRELLMHFARPGDGALEERYFDFIYQARYDAAGQINGLVVFGFEVTDKVRSRQQAEDLQAELLAATRRQLQERETLYQVFEETPAAICIQRGPEHRYAYANAAYHDFFPGRALLGRPVAEVLPEVVDSGVLALLDHVYQTGETYYGEELPLLIAQPDGSSRWMYFTFTYQAYRENGEIVGISTFAYNVAEQVLARQQREAQQRQLQAVFAQAPVAICVFRGPQYVLDVVNPLMGDMLGHAPAALVGSPFFEALPELTSQGLPELLDHVRETGVPFRAQEQAIHLGRHQPGEVGYFNFVYEPLRDAEEQLIGIVCVATEVTEQVRARQQVQDLNEELAAINEELAATNEELQTSNEELQDSNQLLLRTNADLDNFVYTASHDLKVPITNIEGLVHALQAQLPPTAQALPEVEPLLAMMQQSVERFKRTLAYLSDVAQLQQEDGQAAADVALPQVVQDVRQDLLPLIRETGARLEAELADCPAVRFSPKNLRSVVYNLLSNALKYRHSDRTPLIQVRCRQEGRFTVLEVQDNGLGIPKRRQPELFQLFRRLHSHVEGSGIGLYMVKRMAENAGGRVEVESEPEVGSTFRVYFPR